MKSMTEQRYLNPRSLGYEVEMLSDAHSKTIKRVYKGRFPPLTPSDTIKGFSLISIKYLDNHWRVLACFDRWKKWLNRGIQTPVPQVTWIS